MPSRRPHTTQRWWFSVAILGPAVAALVVTAAATLAFVLWTAQGVDQRSLARQNDLARKVIELELARVPHDQQSATVWDDAVTHTKLSYDAAWVDSNLGTWMHDYFGHDEVVILDDKDRPVYDMMSGGPTALRHAEAQLHDLLPFVAALRAQIAAGAVDRYEAGTDPKPPALSDLAVINGVPMLVSISPLISDSGAISQAPGTEYLHISMVHLDAAFAHRISDEYSIASARFSRYAVAQPTEATLPVTNRAGRFITFFNWRVDRPGEDIFRQSLPVLAIGFLIALAVTSLLLYQLWRKSRALDRGRADAEHQARHDPLTRLPNRLHFENALARALALRPSRDRRTTILMLDLDRFKQVNDTLGHQAGDDLIEAVGQRLRQLVDPDDFLARLGGDEFAILTSDAPGLMAPLRLSNRVIEAIGKPFEIFGSEAFVGVSIGIASADGNEADAHELIRKGDIALYEAKTTGRNRAVVFEESMNELLQNRHTIEAELREALRRNDQLSVDFQPLFGADRTLIVGAEALARWRHPRLGLVSPAHFIPVAEASGLIGALGELVLRRACEIGARWPGRVIAVNISPAQLRDPHFPERVFKLLGEARMRPADLELEITEGILLEDASTASEAIRVFRSAGIRIALDDFGTGYSSLNYLKRYPVDRIKIDRSFVSQLAPGSVSNAIVQAMVTLAHALKIEVTAEGVETQEQMDVLVELGCNVFQGFLLSPPVAADALETLFRSAATPTVHAQVA